MRLPDLNKTIILFSCDEAIMVFQLFAYALSQIETPAVAKKLKLPRESYQKFLEIIDQDIKEAGDKKDNINLAMKEDQLRNFIEAYSLALEYAEEWEFPIVTGYSWNEGVKLRDRLVGLRTEFS